ncbi:MAG: NUDIX hydrolase [Spirochaetales bacterium]|nr:NUDIX hydrolase [Spirochaetales bacterium]
MTKLSQYAIKGIILDKDSNMLIVNQNPASHQHPVWDLPGGLKKDDESEIDTLVREIKEELNVSVHIIKKSGKWKFFRPLDNKWVRVQNYVCKFDGGMIRLSNEHSHYQWIKPGDIRNFDIKDMSLLKAIGKEFNIDF